LKNFYTRQRQFLPVSDFADETLDPPAPESTGRQQVIETEES
jgi:hypothetical protein